MAQFQSPPAGGQESKRIVAGVLGILLGALGLHKFVLGMTKPGLIMLLVSVLSCGIISPVMSIIGLIEGIIYLTKSDADFIQTYQIGRKEWF
ncbi:MAG: NINE protein [Phycisphaerales bacterium]